MFTRQETLKITGISDNSLQYLEKTQLIVPTDRIGRKIYYSWTQLIELKTIVKLRETVSLETIRQAKSYLLKSLKDDRLADKSLIIWNKKIVLIDNTNPILDEIRIEITGNTQGQILLHPVLKMDNIINEMLDNVKRNNIVDFNKRLESEGIKPYPDIREYRKLASVG